MGLKMIRIGFSSILAVMATLIFSAAVSAATLTNIVGEIRVNGGDGFKVVTKAITVNVGDKIMAGPSASARVVYSNGVALNLKAGRIMTVSSAKMAKIRSSALLQEAGVIAATGLPAWAPVVAGVAVVGGVAAAVVASQDSSKSAPASP